LSQLFVFDAFPTQFVVSFSLFGCCWLLCAQTVEVISEERAEVVEYHVCLLYANVCILLAIFFETKSYFHERKGLILHRKNLHEVGVALRRLQKLRLCLGAFGAWQKPKHTKQQ
jgi:hypothetical protein